MSDQKDNYIVLFTKAYYISVDSTETPTKCISAVKKIEVRTNVIFKVVIFLTFIN